MANETNVTTCPRNDPIALKAWLVALAKGPAVRVCIGLGINDDVVIHSSKLKDCLRAIPKDFRAYFTSDRLVLAWDSPGRRGCLRLKRLAPTTSMGDALSECYSILSRRKVFDQVGYARREQVAVLVKAVGIPWKYLKSYTCSDVCSRIMARNAAKARKGCVLV